MSAPHPALTEEQAPSPVPSKRQREPESNLPTQLPPQSLDAEQATLGAAMISETAVETLLSELDAEDFYFGAHGEVRKAIGNLRGLGAPVDVLTVPEELRRRGKLEQIGGIEYINRLAESVPTSAHQAWYCREVQEASQLRQIIAHADETKAAAFDRKFPAGELAAKAQNFYISLERDTRHTSDAMALELFPARHVSLIEGDTPDFIKLGVPSIDRLCQVVPGDLEIMAARPSMGKTMTALFRAYHYARNDHFTAYFAFEPKKEPLADRLISSVSGVYYKRIRKRQLSPWEVRNHEDAVALLQHLPLLFVDRSGMTVSAIRAMCLKLKRERNLKVVIIDQLSYVVPELKREKKLDEFGDRIRGLYRMAQDLKLLVIVLHQLSRGVETRTPPRPRLSDLRESGDLEQDADVVTLLYRPIYYEYAAKGLNEPPVGEMEWIQAKGRDSGVGTVRVQVDRSIQRVEPLEEDREEDFDDEPRYRQGSLDIEDDPASDPFKGEPPPVTYGKD